MRLDRIIPMAGAALLAFGGLAACDKAPAPDTATAAGTHPGGPDGAPPCAPEGDTGEYGGTVDTPEKFPLQDWVDYGRKRWAVCGGGLDAAKFLNLRSADDGRTWTVTDTGLSFSPSHAGDRLDVYTSDANQATVGSIRIISKIEENRDDMYQTTDGGLHWSLNESC